MARSAATATTASTTTATDTLDLRLGLGNSYDNNHSYNNNYSYDNSHGHGYPRLTSQALLVLCSGRFFPSNYDRNNGMFGQVGTTAKTRFLTPADDCSSSHVPEGVRNDSYDNNNGYAHNHGNGNRYPR